MSHPMISIVTPTTPERHDLLVETVEHVRQQTYQYVEHVIVADGQDDRLMDFAAEDTAEWYGHRDLRGEYPARWYQLGRHWSSMLPVQAIGVAPILTGLLLARGEYLAWHCDDERFTTPDALSQMVDLLESTGADFAYPRVRMWWNGSTPEAGWDIGTDPPEYGQFTWCLFRSELLTRAMPRFDGQTFNDWDLCSRWVAAGARWTFLDRVLLAHRADR